VTVEDGVTSYDIGLDKFLCPANLPIYMGFSGEVNDRKRLIFVEELRDQLAVCYVSLDEDMALVRAGITEIHEVSGMSQLVEIDDGRLLALRPMPDKIGPDETCATCN